MDDFPDGKSIVISKKTTNNLPKDFHQGFQQE